MRILGANEYPARRQRYAPANYVADGAIVARRCVHFIRALESKAELVPSIFRRHRKARRAAFHGSRPRRRRYARAPRFDRRCLLGARSRTRAYEANDSVIAADSSRPPRRSRKVTVDYAPCDRDALCFPSAHRSRGEYEVGDPS